MVVKFSRKICVVTLGFLYLVFLPIILYFSYSRYKPQTDKKIKRTEVHQNLWIKYVILKYVIRDTLVNLPQDREVQAALFLSVHAYKPRTVRGSVTKIL